MCLICNHHAQIVQINGYRQCEHCKTHIANVLPNNREIQKVLEEHASMFILGDQESLDLRTHTTRLAMLKRYSKSAQTILDFGCGRGDFAKFLLKLGYKAFVYDKSEALKKYIAAQNIPSFDKVKDIRDKYFDVITCYDVIEHTTDPKSLLQTIKNKLKKGGILVISTPNAQGFSGMILGKRWWVFGPTAHYILFSPYSLRLLLTTMGFTILEIRTDTITPWFTPSENFLPKLLNKIVYLMTRPFQSLLFNNYLGDNLITVVRL